MHQCQMSKMVYKGSLFCVACEETAWQVLPTKHIPNISFAQTLFKFVHHYSNFSSLLESNTALLIWVRLKLDVVSQFVTLN